MRNGRILIIESDRNLSLILRNELEYWGYRSECALDAKYGIEKASTGNYSLIITASKIKNYNGLEVVKFVRENYTFTPCILIDSEKSPEAEIISFECGASIYHQKPLNFKLLLAQIKMLLKNEVKRFKINYHNVVIDLSSNTIKNGEFLKRLSKNESKVLSLLLQNPKTIISRQKILKSLSLSKYEVENGSVDTLIYRLRQKTKLSSYDKLIETIYGIGYQINPALKIESF